jgi:tRNA (cmo5U34)-methyltransferase
MSRVKEIWEAGAHLYDEIYAYNISYHRPHAVIVDLLPKKEPMSILDLGAGTGVLAERILKNLPGSSVTCLDFSPSMIEQCRNRLAGFGGRVQLVCADLVTWNPPGLYGAIVTCNAVVYTGMDLRECYRKYASVLRSGGNVGQFHGRQERRPPASDNTDGEPVRSG